MIWCNQRGFTYLGLVILVAIIGLVAVSSLQVGAILQRRQAEEELLAIGREYYDALGRYADATPSGQSPYPGRLEDLLVDPRFPSIRHHLRKVYIDPITGNNEWGVVRGTTALGSGILGIHSLSEANTIKKDNFDAPFEYLKGKTTYSEWIFTTIIPAAAPTTPPANPNSAPGKASPTPKPTPGMPAPATNPATPTQPLEPAPIPVTTPGKRPPGSYGGQ
jgi:type II secretory pathway pseudopilin PulG